MAATAANAAPIVRRTDVGEEPLVGSDRYDYADRFEATVSEPDPRTPEQLMRLALEQSPRAIRSLITAAWRGLLRFDLGPRTSPDHIMGGRIVVSDPDVVQLEAAGPLMRGVIVARRVNDTTAGVATFVYFRRPVARAVWTIAAPLHRAVARYLMKHVAARAGSGARS